MAGNWDLARRAVVSDSVSRVASRDVIGRATWGFDTSRVAANLEATRTAFRGFQSSSVAANLEAIRTAFQWADNSRLVASWDMARRATWGVDTTGLAGNWDVARRAMLGDSVSRVAANLEAIRTALQGFQNSPVLDSSRIVANLDAALAFRTVPTPQVAPAKRRPSNGWLIELLDDEERIRAALPLLAVSSGTCMILGLFFVALVDPTVRAALEILSDEASLGALIVAVVTLMICERK
jgi:hypothetical protein